MRAILPVKIHRHTGGLEITDFIHRVGCDIHRHTGGLEKQGGQGLPQR